MKRYLIMIGFLLLAFIACHDGYYIDYSNSGNHIKRQSSKEPLPGVTDTIYYQQEIFNEVNQWIYGKWILEYISGGITGDGYEPNFDYLEFIPYGIYQFVNADTLLEFGKVVVEEQSDSILKILMSPDPGSTMFFYDSEKFVQFTSDDQLDLNAPCCDRYNYHFKRGN